ncbi:MAG: efflux RND transporter periplasmic adaptor subunit [Verrucomicrobiota bacterium]
MTKPILRGIAVVCLAAALAGCGPRDSGKPKGDRRAGVPVSVAAAVQMPVDRVVTVVGTLFAWDEATLAAEVEGRVETTLVDFGSRVNAGQVLARIDTTTYEALALAAAANLARAGANYTNAMQSLRRVRELQEQNISSAADLDKAMADAGQTAAEVKAAEAAEVIARLNLSRSQVKAPFEAAVSERVASAGDYVKAGTPLFRVVNDSQLKLTVQVAERYGAEIKQGQTVRFSVDQYPDQKFEGRVELISPAINTGTRGLTFAALVTNADRKLKASSYARGEVVLERNAPTILVPLDAVVSFAGVTRVYIVQNGQARARQVKVGRVLETRQEIRSGIQAGEIVVTTGQSKLYDGAAVLLKSADGRVETKSAGATAAAPKSGDKQP